MADIDGREPGDIDSARRLGETLGDQLYRERPSSAQLFRSILNQVAVESAGRLEHGPQRTFAGPIAEIEFFEDLVRLRRLIAYSEDMDLGGILVFTRAENDFGEHPPIDFLNVRARRAFLKGSTNFPDLRGAVSYISSIPGATIRKSRDALVGFMTLFTDSVRASARATATTGTTYVDYTVNSQTKDYQLEYYPQYNFSPEVFGAVLTSPVTENIKTGHYYFQAHDSNNTLHTESRSHFAGKNKTATVIKAF